MTDRYADESYGTSRPARPTLPNVGDENAGPNGGNGGAAGGVSPSGFSVTAMPFEYTGNTVNTSPYNAMGGGPPPGMPHNGAGMPMLHPQLPDAIWVLDPLTRKLRVPTNLIVPTAATATLGTTPSLCLAFLEHRCRHPWCRQAHIPPHVVQRLRQEAQSAPTCCFDHKSPQDITFLTTRFQHIDIAFPNGNRVCVPTSRLAVTVGLQRHIAQVVPKSKFGPSFEVSSRMVCRLHLNHRCRYLEDCNNLHVCREHEPLQTAFTELGPDRSPLAGGAPSQPSSSAHGTPLAGGSPMPTSPSQHGAALPHPPRFGGAGGEASHAGRSPPFAGLPPPSPLVSPANSFSPAPGNGSGLGTPSHTYALPYGGALPPHMLAGSTAVGPANSGGASATASPSGVGGMANDKTALLTLAPGMPHLVVNQRVYNVMALRSGPVTDAEFAALVEAQGTLFGNGKVDTLDLVSGGSGSADALLLFHPHRPASKPPSPAPQNAFGSSLTALPPPAAQKPLSSSGQLSGAPKSHLPQQQAGSSTLNTSASESDRWSSHHTTPQRLRSTANPWGGVPPAPDSPQAPADNNATWSSHPSAGVSPQTFQHTPVGRGVGLSGLDLGSTIDAK
jgi:hypothetical protein